MTTTGGSRTTAGNDTSPVSRGSVSKPAILSQPTVWTEVSVWFPTPGLSTGTCLPCLARCGQAVSRQQVIRPDGRPANDSLPAHRSVFLLVRRGPKRFSAMSQSWLPLSFRLTSSGLIQFPEFAQRPLQPPGIFHPNKKSGRSLNFLLNERPDVFSACLQRLKPAIQLCKLFIAKLECAAFPAG